MLIVGFHSPLPCYVMTAYLFVLYTQQFLFTLCKRLVPTLSPLFFVLLYFSHFHRCLAVYFDPISTLHSYLGIVVVHC